MVWQSLSEPIPSKSFVTPEFRIAQPGRGARVKRGEPLTLEVVAGEGVTLTSVQLYLDSRPVASLPAAPFRTTLGDLA
jgi:hypothetical protein